MGTVTDVDEARVRLDASPTSARAARRFVHDTLRSWGHEDLADTVVLLANELVTNAVLHARSGVELALLRSARIVRVEIIDESPIAPVRRENGVGEVTTGRGLALVEALAKGWGVEPRGRGKSVWFEVPA